MAKVHSFLIRASYGASDVLALLQKIAGDPDHAAHGPAFTFDWLKRKATLSAATDKGVQALVADLRKGIAAVKMGEEALLIGKAVHCPGGRHEVPIGIAVMDAATYADLIRQSLMETNVRARVEETSEGCLLHVPVSLLTQGLPYDDFITGFPVPPYVTIKEIGFRDARKPEKKKPSRKPKS